MQDLINVLQVQTYSGKDERMRAFLERELASIEGCEFFDDGDNIYAGKGTGPRVCMVAHMDTVHPIVEDLTAITINGKITGFNAVKMEQTGIGGDDKVGIYIALQMLKEYDNIKCFFPRDEEIGCVGSSHVEPTFFDDVTFALQCDRRGNSDFITNASGVELSSKAFQDDVLPIITQYGYKFGNGMMTDVMELKERGINVSMANISCGYYNPHEDCEYVDMADVINCTLMVSDIIARLGGITYVHASPPKPKRSAFDFDFGLTRDSSWNYWEEDRPISYLNGKTRSVHSALDDYCQDCWQRPATGIHGLCDECYSYYNNPPWKNKMDAPKSGTDYYMKSLKEQGKLDSGVDRIQQLKASIASSHVVKDKPKTYHVPVTHHRKHKKRKHK